MNMDVFRFSTAWAGCCRRVTGQVNQKGMDFYHRVIDSCLEQGVQPWITLYHWDLPQALEDKGGWQNRDVVPIGLRNTPTLLPKPMATR
jgi:beta-glucosidase